MTRLDSHPVTPTGGEEARAFLQERLAFLGLAYSLIGFSFLALGTLVASRLPQYTLAHPSGPLVLAANGTYLVLWLICRRGRLPYAALHFIDGLSVLLAAGFSALQVSHSFPGEVQGFSNARALLLFTFGLVLRAVIVPSSAMRTLLLGLLASTFPVVSIHLWMGTQPQGDLPMGLRSFFTANWCLGAVIISTLASRVIYGLRKEVRKAMQFGQYTLLEKIGEGGMGAVYRASHAMLRRPTAVKLLLPDKAGAEQLERFEREVQLTSRLTHPNTVAIFDYGRTPDGVFYYAMEYLEGVNLEELVRLTGPQPAARVVHILRQVARSLAEAHGIGLIHRDIKPANVILVAERGGMPDVAKVVDFGLVKDLDRNARHTQEGLLVGTPHYLSPEGITSPDLVGPRSDLYALGCVAYFLVAGKTLFEGKTVIDVAAHHLNSRPIPPAQRRGGPVPESLSELILACLEKDPDHRPQSARVFLSALDAVAEVPVWTEDRAQAWWSSEGRDILARIQKRASDVAIKAPLSPEDLECIRCAMDESRIAAVSDVREYEAATH
jgi:serine/threonine-protein kinase